MIPLLNVLRWGGGAWWAIYVILKAGEKKDRKILLMVAILKVECLVTRFDVVDVELFLMDELTHIMWA